MKDVHAMPPEREHLDLARVGIEGIRKPLVVRRPERGVTLAATFSLAVDLPADRKGSDLSRNAELLAEAIDWPERRPVASLEEACRGIARELLERHPYASRSEVRASAEYFLPRAIAPGRESLENYTLFAEGRGQRTSEGLEIRRAIGAEAVGMTACPCAMESTRTLLTGEFPALGGEGLRELPIITHNQRNRTRLTFELDGGAEVEADRIVEAIEAAQSAPTYAILKRGDEAKLVVDAHRRPRFVEDVARELLASLPERFPGLPDDTRVRVETRSEESIHKYDVIASHETTMGALRRP